MVRRHALRNDQWLRIESLLPGREGTVGVTAKDNRLFVEAVLYRYRAGIPWRDLPERFGDFRVVHTRFSRWVFDLYRRGSDSATSWRRIGSAPHDLPPTRDRDSSLFATREREADEKNRHSAFCRQRRQSLPLGSNVQKETARIMRRCARTMITRNDICFGACFHATALRVSNHSARPRSGHTRLIQVSASVGRAIRSCSYGQRGSVTNHYCRPVSAMIADHCRVADFFANPRACGN